MNRKRSMNRTQIKAAISLVNIPRQQTAEVGWHTAPSFGQNRFRAQYRQRQPQYIQRQPQYRQPLYRPYLNQGGNPLKEIVNIQGCRCQSKSAPCYCF